MAWGALGVLLLWVTSGAAAGWKLFLRKAPFAEPASSVPGVAVEGLRLTSSDGVECGAWFVRGDEQHAALLLLHAHGSSRTAFTRLFCLLAKEGLSVLAITRRSHGDSGGGDYDYGWSSRLDVLAAVEFLEKELPRQPIVLLGSSAGSAAATFAAPELVGRVAGYILESPYNDLFDAAMHRLRIYLPDALAPVAFASLRLWAPVFMEMDPAEIRPIDHAPELEEGVPKLVLAGTKDLHAPIHEVEAFAATCPGPTRVVTMEAAHGQLFSRFPGPYLQLVLEFCQDVRASHDAENG